jgi:pyruvate/2-oxoglutarate dehydrogenase complex dihydrolipoamide acyltransferase (E2) component
VEVPVSKEGKEIKITDKRMFTADGELRQEYRFLDEKSTAPAATPAAATAVDAAAGAPAAAVPPARPAAPAGPAAPAVPAASPSARDAAGRRAEPSEEAAGGGAGESGVRLEIPGSPPGLGASFYDLAAMLAEPVAIYLGDLELPDGQSAENLEMARLHIDLLDILRQKTAGNLTAQESAFLEDLLYRLRVRYVQKRG